MFLFANICQSWTNDGEADSYRQSVWKSAHIWDWKQQRLNFGECSYGKSSMDYWTICRKCKRKINLSHKVRHDFAFAFSESSAEGDISYEFESGNHYQKSRIGNIEAQSAHYGIKCYVWRRLSCGDFIGACYFCSPMENIICRIDFPFGRYLEQ